MIIIGAGGFAKEVLEIFDQRNDLDSLAFYDDVTANLPRLLYDQFPILRSEDHVIKHFKTYGSDFTIAVGKPKLRKMLYEKFLKLGGILQSTISINSEIGNYNIKIGEGCNILSGVKISNSVNIGKGCIIYYNSVVTHDVEIGNFTEISPGVTLLGNCKIGHSSTIGTGAIILPNIKVGNNVIVGAGTVVTKDLPDNCIAVGVPAKIIRILAL